MPTTLPAKTYWWHYARHHYYPVNEWRVYLIIEAGQIIPPRLIGVVPGDAPNPGSGAPSEPAS